MMIPEAYMKRVAKQIGYYDSRAKLNKRFYIIFKIVLSILSATIPVITLLCTGGLQEPIKFVIALLGALVAVLTGILSLCKFQEHWVSYRSASEALISLKSLYEAKVPPFHDENANILFVSNCEKVMQQTNSSWLIFITQTELPNQVNS